MDALCGYLLSVIAAALICGCVSSLVGNKGSISNISKLLCGLFLAITAMKPITDVRIEDMKTFTASIEADADAAVASGENIATEEMMRIIKDEVEAYIINKAKQLQTDLEVEVVLDGIVPAAVRVSGDFSPYVKSSIANSIARDLDIPQEEQIWNRRQ